MLPTCKIKSATKDDSGLKSDDCAQDKTVFCDIPALKKYCHFDEFRKLCCDSCKNYTPARHDGVELDEGLNQHAPVWTVSSWRECEPHIGKCGDGYNYREVQCKQGNNVIPDVSCHEKKPATARNCEIKCPDECVKDQSVFCGVMYLREYCRTDEFRKLCCDSCKPYTTARHDGVELGYR